MLQPAMRRVINRMTTERTVGKRMPAKRTVAAAVLAVLALATPGRTADTVDLDAARREGKVVWYTSTPIELAQKLVSAFEQQTGIKVELFRSGGTAILRRFLQEREGGRVMADVLYTADPAATASLARKGVFVPFKPKNFDKIEDVAKDPDGNYFALRLNMITLFVRRDRVAAADTPATWSDLLDPKHKGKMVIADPSFTAVQVTVIGTLARKLGWSYYEGLRRNDIMVVQGNQQVADMLKRGERLIAAGALDSYAFDARREGHAIDNVFPRDGTFAVPGPVAVVKGSPNPNAAKVFAEFLISDTVQQIVVADGAYSARTDLPPPEGGAPLKDIKLFAVDYEQIEKDAGAIKKKFNEIFQ
jgi:iron(III) transport system substrate-binding protein